MPRWRLIIGPHHAHSCRYAVAFYFGLRNTLVASDLEEATRVAYRGDKCMWRVVTKTGELIDTSGTMSGGGSKVRRGAMKAVAAPTVTPEEMAAAERDLAKYQTQLLNARNTASLLTSEVRRRRPPPSFAAACPCPRQRHLCALPQKRGLEKSVPALGVRVSKLEMEVKSLTARLAELEQRREVLEGQAGVSEADAAALEELTASVAVLNKKYQKVKVVTDKLEGEVEALQKRIMNVGGKRLQSQKAKVRCCAPHTYLCLLQPRRSPLPSLGLCYAGRRRTRSAGGRHPCRDQGSRGHQVWRQGEG